MKSKVGKNVRSSRHEKRTASRLERKRQGELKMNVFFERGVIKSCRRRSSLFVEGFPQQSPGKATDKGRLSVSGRKHNRAHATNH